MAPRPRSEEHAGHRMPLDRGSGELRQHRPDVLRLGHPGPREAPQGREDLYRHGQAHAGRALRCVLERRLRIRCLIGGCLIRGRRARRNRRPQACRVDGSSRAPHRAPRGRGRARCGQLAPARGSPTRHRSKQPGASVGRRLKFSPRHSNGPYGPPQQVHPEGKRSGAPQHTLCIHAQPKPAQRRLAQFHEVERRASGHTGARHERTSERRFVQLHQVQRRGFRHTALGRQGGQPLPGEEPGGGNLALVEPDVAAGGRQLVRRDRRVPE